MARRKSLVTSLGMVLSVTLILMTSAVWAAEVNEIKIGAVLPMTGFLGPIGKEEAVGHSFAIDKVNAAGGIKSLGGAKAKLLVMDTESKDENAISQTERLITNEKVAVITGCYGSSAAYVATMIAEKYNTPIILPYAVADKITGRGFKNVFRICFMASSNSEDNYKLLKWLGETTGIHAKTVGFLYEDTLWGQSSAKAWKELADKYGLKIVADVSYAGGSKDFTAQILKLKIASPDVMLELSYIHDGILIVRTMKDLGFKPKMARISIGHNEDQYYEATKGLNENVFVNAAWFRSLNIPKAQVLNKAYQDRYGKPIGDGGALSYMATVVAIDAIERAGSPDPGKIREALAMTNMVPQESENVLPYVIKFDKTGQIKEAPTCFAQFIKEEPMAVYPPKYAAVKPIWPAYK
jgi:branched-chain amino acid transport system substrate-binding protein